MSSRHLPGDASLENLRKQAKTLLDRYRSGDGQAVALVRELEPSPPAALRLADAQRVTARLYGFASWPKLVRHVETVRGLSRSPHTVPVDASTPPADAFLALACLTYGADDPVRPRRGGEILQAHPELPGLSVHVAAAVGDVEAVARHVAGDRALATAEGGLFRWEPLLYLAYSRVTTAASDHVATARLLLEHGASPDAGYLWEGECRFTALTGVFGGGEQGNSQPPHPAGLELARVLLDAGADPNDDQALYNRHFRPEDDHLELLLAYGLGTGDGGPWNRAVGGPPDAPRIMLEDQLLFACANGHEGRVELLLSHGVDASGRGSGHPALRGRSAIQLALDSGSEPAVRLLVEHGAALPELDEVDRLLVSLTAGNREEAGRAL
ncbi:MAG: ankyrin repeat domain-containing protein, partial [Actinobacteria bacterium]|nr:ankyrin repeat domain-containing protein [Actinomycetota bacterium]